MTNFPKMKLGTDNQGHIIRVSVSTDEGETWVDLTPFVTGINLEYEANRKFEVTLSVYAEVYIIGPVPE